MVRAVFLDTISPMSILTEIHRSPGINIKGKTVHRTAVRGVILRGRTLLMIYSSNVGDYKFPGGGVGVGESRSQALRREIQEECGIPVVHVGPEIGAVIEYDLPVEEDYDLFKMTSHYYFCDVEGEFEAQKLEDYEQDLGFKPVWIDIDQAIQLNKALLHSDQPPRWLRREIFALEYIQRTRHLIPGT
jgi:8-oxo-dGTP pyrophosphatase MutT (NUDIX family)